MTLEQLRMLKLVAELGTLKSASEALYKTQPAVSQGIKQLESQLGLTLFSREGYRLALTAEGKRIYQHATNVLSETSQLQQVARHLAQGNEAQITLAFEASLDLAPVLPLLEQLQYQYPDTRIILRQEYMSGAFESVSDGRADIAISPIERHLVEDRLFQFLSLYQGSLVNVAAPRLLERHAGLSHVRQLRDEYQIVVQDSGQSTRDKEFGVQAGQRRWYVNDFTTKKTLTISGMGWGKLPYYLIRDELADGRLCQLELEELNSAVQVEYYAIRRAAEAPGPVASQLWQQLAALSAQA